MSQTVQVPELGEVEFPNSMSPVQIKDAIDTHLGKNQAPSVFSDTLKGMFSPLMETYLQEATKAPSTPQELLSGLTQPFSALGQSLNKPPAQTGQEEIMNALTGLLRGGEAAMAIPSTAFSVGETALRKQFPSGGPVIAGVTTPVRMAGEGWHQLQGLLENLLGAPKTEAGKELAGAAGEVMPAAAQMGALAGIPKVLGRGRVEGVKEATPREAATKQVKLKDKLLSETGAVNLPTKEELSEFGYRILSAAVRLNGKLLTGANHPNILKAGGVQEEYTPEQRNKPIQTSKGLAEFGYLGTTGKLVPRDVAARIATGAKQDLVQFGLNEPAHSDEIATKPGGQVPISESGAPSTEQEQQRTIKNADQDLAETTAKVPTQEGAPQPPRLSTENNLGQQAIDWDSLKKGQTIPGTTVRFDGFYDMRPVGGLKHPAVTDMSPGGSGTSGGGSENHPLNTLQDVVDWQKAARAKHGISDEMAPERKTSPQQIDSRPEEEVRSEPPTSGGPKVSRPIRVAGEPVGKIQTAEEKMQDLGETKAPQPNLTEEKKRGTKWMDETGATTLFAPKTIQDVVDRIKEDVKLSLTRDGKWPGGALFARLQNVLPPEEKEIANSQGLKEFLSSGKTPEEVAKWWQEKMPKVEVRKLSAEQGPTRNAQEYAKISHDLDTRFPGWRDHDLAQAEGEEKQLRIRMMGIDPDELASKDNESATARYTMVNPKSLDQMPGAVDILVRIPLKGEPADITRGAIDVRTPTQIVKDERAGIKYESSHYPTEGKNLVAHVRGYMETMPDGRKVFHVFEVQSDWAQERRSLEGDKNLSLEDRKSNELVSSDPLLKHYERLALKAAIEHARSAGADAIAISDAETAMMTEGHDRTHGIQELPTWEPSQAKGMRLHYDQTLPKIVSELTGAKGERVEFGEHQNAIELNPTVDQDREGVKNQRKDLIFKNPDGSPKTSISARLYPIEKAQKSFTLFGRDKPVSKGLMSEKGSVYLPEKKDIYAILDHLVGPLQNRIKRELEVGQFKMNVGKTLDAVDEGADRGSEMEKNRVNKEWFHRVPKLDKQAVQFLVEAEFNKGQLAKDVAKLKGTWAEEVGQRALQLVDNPGFISKAKMVEEYYKAWHKKLTNAGVLVGEEKNYIPRPFADIEDPVTGKRRNLNSDPARQRNVEKLVDRIASGEKFPWILER